MTELDTKSVRKEEAEFIGKSISEAVVLFLNDNYTPGEIAAGLSASLYAIQRAHGMSAMQVSNQIHELADKIRDQHFAKKKSH